MRYEHTVLSVELGEDLLPFSGLLHSRGVAHRIIEHAGQQVLQVTDPDQVQPVRDAYRAWRDGKITIELRPAGGHTTDARQRQAVAWRSVPVTLCLIALSCAGFLLIYLRGPLEWVSLLTFNPFFEQDGGLRFGPVDGQYWRLVTPAFLHFGWLHVVFNCLWLWELGGRIEQALGQIHMLGLFLATAIGANLSQYLFGGPSLFGGMSGVVYGLLGFSWAACALQPRWTFQPSQPVVLFMVGWLVLCVMGVVESMGFGAVANAAHVGGLICGLLLGAGFGLVSRYNSVPG